MVDLEEFERWYADPGPYVATTYTSESVRRDVSLLIAELKAARAEVKELRRISADYTEIADAFGYANWHEGHAQVADPKTIIAGAQKQTEYLEDDVKELIELRDELLSRHAAMRRELEAARELAKAARGRFDVWTADTYEALRVALVDYHDATKGGG